MSNGGRQGAGGPVIGRRALLAGVMATPAARTEATVRVPPGTVARSRVGKDGVWRWPDGREVALFGVNYDIASASAFRFAKATGQPFETIVAGDLAHFRRLGFDGLRLCFWGDWENSTADGTLVENEHLAVLDLVVARAGAAGLHCLLSPFVTYDASWPDAMEAPRAGVSHAFKKDVLGTDPAAIAAQARYLGQLLSRTNPLTGRRYADEPAIVAVEPINEPYHHSADRAGSIRYIDALASAIRGAGFDGPIFYNASQDMGIAPAIAAAKVDGATFAWYPTGLQNGRAVDGSLLLVERYDQMRVPALRARAKLVYEFDAADTLQPCFYPAMVRAFREGGAQFAAMFAYDSLPIAGANSEFNDHFLNLAYTPAKAVSALIAATAMHTLRRGVSYDDPTGHSFAGFSVDDEANNSTFADATRFYHAGDTDRDAPDPSALRHLAGCGSSRLVEYDGTGAWFLDRVATGVWRLEVYPDAVTVDNPFVFRRPGRPSVRIVSRRRRIAVALPDLGTDFDVTAADGRALGRAERGATAVAPGVYRLSRRGVAVRAVDPVFVAPAADRFDPVLLHQPPRSLTAGEPWRVELAIASPEAPADPALYLRTADGVTRIALIAGRGFGYTAQVPAAAIMPGFLDYYVTIGVRGAGQVWPTAEGAWPGDWDFPRRGGFRVGVREPSAPLSLWDAALDGDRLLVPYGGYSAFPAIRIAPGFDGQPALRLDGAGLAREAQGDLPAQFGWHGAFPGIAAGTWRELLIEGRSLKSTDGVVGIILIGRDGSAWGAPLRLRASGEAVRIALAALTRVKAAMLPRDFPVGINPYWLRTRAGGSDRPVLANLRAVQFTAATRFLEPGDDPAPLVEVERLLLLR